MKQEYYDKLLEAYECYFEHSMHYVVTEETTPNGLIFYLVIPRQTYLANLRYGYKAVACTLNGSITWGLDS